MAISDANLPDYITLLTQAARAFQVRINHSRTVHHGMLSGETIDRVDHSRKQLPHPTSIIDALLQAEKATKQQHRDDGLKRLLGHWRLCFTTSRKVNLKQGKLSHRSGFYIPQLAAAQISFLNPEPSVTVDPEHLEIHNQIQTGGLLLRITGPARYVDRKSLLAFGFTQMQLKLLGKTVYQGAFPSRKAELFGQQRISELPFFTFFLITDDFIAARGRGGGLALWVRHST